MNRYEALHILGLDEHATVDDIKVAYRELAQIMHPDKFQSNQRLQNRATEQFKTITAAKDLLLSEQTTTRQRAGYEEAPSQTTEVPHITEKEQLKIQLNAAETARLTLLSYVDAESDRRKTNLILLLVGLCLAFAARKFPAIAVISSGLVIYGIIGAVSSHMQTQDLKEQIQAIEDDKRRITQKLMTL